MAHLRTLPERLVWARETACLSQRGLARRAHLPSERHIGLIESGERDNLTIETIKKIAEALGVTVGWLSNGEGEKPSEKKLREIGCEKGAA